LCHEARCESIEHAVLKDEGRPLGFAYQKEKSNHLMRLSLRVMVVSDKEKAGRDLSGEFDRDE